MNIWRSTDGGATWSAIWDWGPWPTRIFKYAQDITGAPWLTFAETPELPEVSPKLGWMMGDIEIDPFNSNRLLYGTGATIYGTDDLTNWDRAARAHQRRRRRGWRRPRCRTSISPPAGRAAC